MLQVEHSAILSTFIKLPFLIKNFVLSFLSDILRQVLLYCEVEVLIRMNERPTYHSNTEPGGS